ncbi:hypothetical protein GCM10027403_26900 [Arthrobacter tecti]
MLSEGSGQLGSQHVDVGDRGVVERLVDLLAGERVYEQVCLRVSHSGDGSNALRAASNSAIVDVQLNNKIPSSERGMKMLDFGKIFISRTTFCPHWGHFGRG